MKLLVANRGEIAIRIARAAAELDIPTVAIYSEDDARSLHVCKADESVSLEGIGARAYLDMEQIISIAQDHDCDAIHPGYGFLAENAAFARMCADQGIVFVGPTPENLELFGDKCRARALAEQHEVPLVEGISESVNLDQARAFFEALPPDTSMLFKAVEGGGGRGLRMVSSPDEIEDAFQRARSEAEAAFGTGEIYVERMVRNARHIEVQIAGDHLGAVVQIGDRDCSIQRRHQKLIEIAPAPMLPDELRVALAKAAVKLAKAAQYRNLGTFEFLVETTGKGAPRFSFMEANARLQVEHTVTEEVTGIDLVQLQLELARGKTLKELGCTQKKIPAARGYAIQTRVNMETMTADGGTKPSVGLLTAFDLPSGPGLRTDTFGYSGYQTNPNFDSLLAKVIGHSPDTNFAAAVKRTYRALGDFRIEGMQTNIAFLRAILMCPDFLSARVHTRYVDEHFADLIDDAESRHLQPFFNFNDAEADPSVLAGAKVDTIDPLAVIDHGKTGEKTALSAPSAEPVLVATSHPVPDGTVPLYAPMQGTIVSIEVSVGDDVLPGRLILVMEAMKMEHEIRTSISGTIHTLIVSVGDAVYEGYTLAFIEEKEVDIKAGDGSEDLDLDFDLGGHGAGRRGEHP